MVVYYSGTGNSRYCAQLLAERLGDELMDAFHFIRDGVAAELLSQRPWVFVAPTYGWQLPHIFECFLRAGSFAGSNDAYFVMSCGSEIGAADEKNEALCREKGLTYRGTLEVVMPENYVAMFPVPGEATSRRIIAAAHPTLEQGAECIRQNRPFPARKTGALDNLKSRVVNPLFYAFCVKASPFRVTADCTGCGRCVRGCPMNNVRLVGGKPVWGKECTHCMACICACPAHAVEYGRRSVGKPRYQCPDYTR